MNPSVRALGLSQLRGCLLLVAILCAALRPVVARAEHTPICTDPLEDLFLKVEHSPVTPRTPLQAVTFEAHGHPDFIDPDLIVLSPDSSHQTGIKSVHKGKLLASGGMGQVFEADIKWNGKHGVEDAVIKIPYLHPKMDPALNLTLEGVRKQEEQGVLQHNKTALAARKSGKKYAKNIVPIYGRLRWVDEATGQMTEGWVMPRVGKSIDHPEISGMFKLKIRDPSWLAQHRAAIPQRVRRIGRAIGDMIDILAQHSEGGVVNHDIKGANLVLAGGKENNMAEFDRGEAHISSLDFGIATHEGNRRQTARGTKGYIDPPLHKPQSKSSHLNDAYAAGVVATEMMNSPADHPELTGARPPTDARKVWSNIKDEKGKPVHHLSHATTVDDLMKARELLAREGILHGNDLDIFDDARKFVEICMAPIDKRVEMANRDGAGIIRLSPTGQVLGRGPVLERHLEELNRLTRLAEHRQQVDGHLSD